MGLFKIIRALFRRKKQKIKDQPALPPAETPLALPPETILPEERGAFIPKKDVDKPERVIPLPERTHEQTLIEQESHSKEHLTSNDMENEKEKWIDPEPNLPPELDFLFKLILFRLKNYDKQRAEYFKQQLPALKEWRLPILDFIKKSNIKRPLKDEELILLLIAIVPHIQPDLIDAAVEKHLESASKNGPLDFPRIGGVRGKNCRFFLPTGETAIFVIADEDLDKRLEVQQLFGAEHLFWEKKILWLEDMQHGEPAMHGRLIMSPDYVDLLTHGIHKSPQFSISFPAKKIAPTKIKLPDDKDDSGKKTKEVNYPTFNDLVIPAEVREQFNELINWLTYNDELMQRFNMKGKLRNGYRSLFYGLPGTGKTFAAQILGNELNRDVYKIDLSMVVSKYIGETEKNLELLFARAENKNWILFFDEADALFGKRTNVRDAHDKYANQEVSYLLQRIEDYNGLVILATNIKQNIDDAFLRRFNSIIKFPFPNAEQRAEIWRKSFPPEAIFADKPGTDIGYDKYDTVCVPQLKRSTVDIPEAVKKFELTGGNINNVVHYACLKAVERLYPVNAEAGKLVSEYAGNGHGAPGQEEYKRPFNDKKLVIYLEDVKDGIKRELIKEGKPF